MNKKICVFIIALLFLIPIQVSAYITCNDGTTSPSCSDCHRGCCSRHGGCSSSSSPSSTSSSSNNSYSNNNNNAITVPKENSVSNEKPTIVNEASEETPVLEEHSEPTETPKEEQLEETKTASIDEQSIISEEKSEEEGGILEFLEGLGILGIAGYCIKKKKKK